ncbi:MAG: DNA recombination protein RmuC [Burkholderiales bacterium]
MNQPQILIYIALGLLALLVIISVWGLLWLARLLRDLPAQLDEQVENHHRGMLSDLHDGFSKQTDRILSGQSEASDRLRGTLNLELSASREATHALQLSQGQGLAANREELVRQLAQLSGMLQQKQDLLRTDLLGQTLQKLAEQARADQELFQTTLTNVTQQLTARLEGLTGKVDERLEQISGKVHERLEEGFKKTNETFANVMARLATIDEAQKKIDGLTTNVVSLQELLGDKRSRGAFGEVQLEALVANIMPSQSYKLQHTLSNGSRVDCALFLPDPTGTVSVDAKFPLENYHRMFSTDMSAADRNQVERQFKADIKGHVDAISSKYIIANETSDGAVMFIPAEAVFAEIHAYHSDVVDYAMQRRVWIVSPTTLMAVLNTARAVMKDVETRKQIHIIKDELGKLGKDFSRFDERMKKLADHIRQANQDATEIHVSSRKISDRFAQIERVELDAPKADPSQWLEEKESGS